METRYIIAYALLAALIIAATCVIGSLSRNNQQARMKRWMRNKHRHG
ncbi:hypothetical protein [Sphingomonas koreensis]|nr:hypothetical protein [Sphingomonas koreensis]